MSRLNHKEKKMAEKKAKKIEEVKEDVTVVEADTNVAQMATEKPEEIVAKEPKEEKKIAKAGKRSEKAQKEVAEKIAKEDRKVKGDTTPQEGVEAKAKQKQKPTRSKLERRGKNYRKVAEQIEKGKLYSLKDALELATKTNVGKFDGTVEIHLNLNVDPRQADQNVRGTVSLPNGTGKTVRVAVFAAAADAEKAKKAGADLTGEEELLAKLDKEQLDFDVLIATPANMPKLGKYARLLGPRGLMPNPKSGTVTANVAKAVQEAKAGRVEYRVDKQGIVHQGVGKVSFGGDKLYTNAKAFIDNLSANKPSSIKGALMKGIAISTTMGPGIRVDVSSL
jgi:ribosomal protein L1